MEAKDDPIRTWTTAGPEYDYANVKDLGVVGHMMPQGKAVRCVEHLPVPKDVPHTNYLVTYQRDRYRSGLHLVADATEWGKLVEYGLVTVVMTVEP